jgi:hypothetical protein
LDQCPREGNLVTPLSKNDRSWQILLQKSVAVSREA